MGFTPPTHTPDRGPNYPRRTGHGRTRGSLTGRLGMSIRCNRCMFERVESRADVTRCGLESGVSRYRFLLKHY